jgi:hypothetical protein
VFCNAKQSNWFLFGPKDVFPVIVRWVLNCLIQFASFYCILSFYSALFGIYVRCTRVSHFARLKFNIYISTGI